MDGQKAGSNIEHPLSDQQETLRMSLKNTTSSLVSYAQAQDEILNSLDKGQETAALEEEKLKFELSIVKERYSKLVKESSWDKQLPEASRERAMRDWKRKRMEYMEEEIKQISFAFSSRQRSLISFHNEIKSKMQKLTTHNPKLR